MRSRLSLLILFLCAVCVFVECDLDRRDVHRIILTGKSKKTKKNRPKKPHSDREHYHRPEHLQGSVEYIGFSENEALPSNNQYSHDYKHHHYNLREEERLNNQHFHRDNYKQNEDYRNPIKQNEDYRNPIKQNEDYRNPIKQVHKFNEDFHELMKPKHKHNEEFYELMKPKPPGPEDFLSYPEEMSKFENQGSSSNRHNVPIRSEILGNWSPIQNHHHEISPELDEYNSKPTATSPSPKKKKHRKPTTTERSQKSTNTIEFTTAKLFKQSHSALTVTDPPQLQPKYQTHYRKNNNNYNNASLQIKTEASNTRPLKTFPPTLNPELLQDYHSSYEVYESYEDARPPKHQLLHNLAPIAPTVFTQLSHMQKYPPGSYQKQKYPLRNEQPLKYSSGEIRDEFRNKYGGNYGLRTQSGRPKEHFRYK